MTNNENVVAWGGGRIPHACTLYDIVFGGLEGWMITENIICTYTSTCTQNRFG